MSKRWRRIAPVALLVLAFALFAAACGGGDDAESSATGTSGESSSSSSAADVAGAQAEIDKYTAVPPFEPEPSAFDASKAKGKLIWAVPINSALPYQQAIDAGMKDAAAAAGVDIQFFENQGTVKEWVAGIEQGISRKADLIMLDAAPNPAQLQPQIAAAKKAGIPIIATNMPTDDQFPPGALSKDNVANLDGVTPGPFGLPAALMADYAIANTPDGEVNALIVASDEVASSKGMKERVIAQIEERCPDCKTKVINVPLVDWATKIQGQVQTALTQDPNVNWVLPIYDSMAQFIIPAIRASGRTDQVKIATFNGTPAFLKEIQGGDIIAMDVGQSLDQTGWAAVDQALRLMAGEPAHEYAESAVPVRVWTDDNVSEAGSPPEATKGYGEEYQDGYRELWGLAG